MKMILVLLIASALALSGRL